MSQRFWASKQSQNNSPTDPAPPQPPSSSPVTGPGTNVGYSGDGLVLAATNFMGPKSSQTQPPSSIEPASSRLLGVQSILNPSQPEARDQGPDQRQWAQAPSSYAAAASLPALLPPPLVSPRVRKRGEPELSPNHGAAATAPRTTRRVLTPKSPGLRATSLGGRRTASHAPAGGQQGPSFPNEGRVYTAEPGQYRDSDIPPLPTTALGGHMDLPRIQTTAVPTAPSQPPPGQHGRRTSNPALTGSETESPNTSRFSYGSNNRSSPILRYGAPSAPQNAYQTSQNPAGTGFGQTAQSTPAPEASYSMGQGSYQMTLDTEQGPIVVPVELDLQQASKVADEKRKRNAGASARFRQRRKEKEQQASQAIANYERDVQELQEARDFYINERNFFRDLLARTAGPSAIPPRPRSPVLRRYRAGTTASSEGPSRSRELSESPVNIQRRRTGDYQPSLRGQLAASPMMPPQPPNYGPINLPPPPPPLSAPEPRPGLPPPPPAPPPNPHSRSYDPLRQNPFDRSWNHGR